MYLTHFITPGELPLSAFNRFGVNHKPNSDNPIGYFGTGIKYGVAIVLRCGGRVHLRTDKGHYEFYAKEEDFRGKSFDGVRMRRRNHLLSKWAYDKLPFTTELGKNWQLWQAYREMVSNTFDEGGYVTGDIVGHMGEDPTQGRWIPGTSVITVEMPNSLFDVYREEEQLKVHLPRDADMVELPIFENVHLEVFDTPSTCLYYKGIRVYDFPVGVEAQLTYNLKEGVVLSEDRSVRNQYQVLDWIVQALDQLPDGITHRVMEVVHGYESTYLPMNPSSVSESGSGGALRRMPRRPGGYYAGSLYDHFNKPEDVDIKISINVTATADEWYGMINELVKLGVENFKDVLKCVAHDPEIYGAQGDYQEKYPLACQAMDDVF